MKKTIAVFIIILLILPLFVFADIQTVTINMKVSGVYAGVNYWENAVYTIELTNGVPADYGWLSNGEYSFKYYHADSIIKNGANKSSAFSCSHVPELIVIPTTIGKIESKYFSYPERSISLYASNDDQGLFVSNSKADTDIVIPEGVTEIPGYVFAHNNGNNKNMRFLLPSTLKKINKNAFAGFSSGGLYAPFSLPEELEFIGNGAFSQCRYDSVVIPSAVTAIGNSSFTYNTRLKIVVFKGNIESIGSESFAYCKELKSMTFMGKSAPSLNKNTFKGFVDGYEFYVYYPYNGIGYDSEEWQKYFPPNTHFLKIDKNGDIVPEEAEVNIYKDDFDKMRLKWREMLLAENADINDPDIANNILSINERAKGYWESLIKNDTKSKIWADCGLTSERQLQTTYERLLLMAQAYALAGGDLYHNTDMLADIVSSLRFIYDNGYYSSTGGGNGNWWQWQIGIPQKIIRICIILYDELPQRDKLSYMSATRHFQNDITMTGANRMWECEVFIGRGIIENNAANMQSAKEGISAVIGMVKSGDGYYSDGSFIQHSNYPYNGGYGQSLFANIAEMIYLLNDSPWEVNEAAVSNIYKWIYDSYMPFIYKGQFMDMVRGREMARYNSGTYYIGTKVISAMVNIAQYAPKRYADEIKSMVKYWYSENDMIDFYSNMSNYSIGLTKSIINDSSIQPMEEPIFYKQFYNMDRSVQARPDYAVGISMYSNRIGAFESINSENQRSYHTADGMIYLYNDDFLHYHDSFWPTVNLFRLSGTTVERNTQIPANSKGTSPWAGGVSLDNKYGITSMQLEAIGQSLKAKKSYFMFDDEIVCLGSGINSNDNIEVETIVENRKLSSNRDILTINGKIIEGPQERISDAKWAAIEGEYADIGYYFPSFAEINALKEEREGTWKNMSSSSNNVTYTADYATMWIEHGVNPENERYEYVILPDKSAEQTEAYKNNPDIEILSNTEEIQAVHENKNNITGVNFWADGKKSIGGITSDTHGSVMSQIKDGVMYVSVSDPARTNKGLMNIEISSSANRVITTDSNVVVHQIYPTVKMSVYMGEQTGESFGAVFDLTGDDNYEYGKDTYIIDNNDKEFETEGLNWKLSTSADCYGKNCIISENDSTDNKSRAKWTPCISASDEYDIYIRWTSASSRSDCVQLEIAYADGVDTSKYINQQYNGGIWTYIGTYKMSEGSSGYVKMLSNENGDICADAVKFVAHSAMGNSPFVYVDMQNSPQSAEPVCEEGLVTAVMVRNAQSAGIRADLLVAVYDGINLVNLLICPNIKTAELMPLETPVAYNRGNTVKAFLWNLNELNNLTE